jgi:hypothetical protein
LVTKIDIIENSPGTNEKIIMTLRNKVLRLYKDLIRATKKMDKEMGDFYSDHVNHVRI